MILILMKVSSTFLSLFKEKNPKQPNTKPQSTKPVSNCTPYCTEYLNHLLYLWFY